MTCPALARAIPAAVRQRVARAFALVAALVALASLAGCTVRGRDAAPGDADLDLSAWDFDARGPVNLGGRWEFLEGTLDVAELDRGSPGRLMVPFQDGPSTDATGHAPRPLGHGVARLRVKLPPRPPAEGELTVYLPYVYSAAEWHVRIDQGDARGLEIVRTATVAQNRPNQSVSRSVLRSANIMKWWIAVMSRRPMSTRLPPVSAVRSVVSWFVVPTTGLAQMPKRL